jgi:RHH-type transcriptional regulator, rel operon repressor / antitoxin RelB
VLICVQEGTIVSITTTVTVRVPTRLKDRLDKLADATARSRSWLAAHALEVYVEDQEWQLATIRKGKKDAQAGRVVSHEKTARWLRSWGKKSELPPPSCE